MNSNKSMNIIYRIEISEEAEKEITNSTDYYASQQNNLGKRFFSLVLNSFDNISQNPFAYPKTSNNLRKCVMKKFPFVILYIVDETIIRIIAVFHTSRNPEIIDDRFRKD